MRIREGTLHKDEDIAKTRGREPKGAVDGEARGGRKAAGLIPLSALRASAKAEPSAEALRERLSGLSGRRYWRSLEELSNTEEFQRHLGREFAHQAPGDMRGLPRRDFLKLMGAAMALAGLSGCAYQPAERIVPYVEEPENLVPGTPLFYATAFTLGGYAYGVLGESHMGRPTKIEGNPQHPASLGATNAFAQASLLTLYDPDRSQAVRHLGNPTTWDAFVGEMTRHFDALRETGGAGLRILTETTTSPSLADLMDDLLTSLPEARWYQYDPVGRSGVRDGARLAFGQVVQPVYDLSRADRVLSLDSNFLLEDPGSVRYARDFSSRRRVRDGETEMNRLYVVESTPTITGSVADHRVRVRPSEVEAVARAFAAALGAGGGMGPSSPPKGVSSEWISAVARDLRSRPGASLVLAGDHQPPIVHALAHAMNQALDSVGRTVTYVAPVEATPSSPGGTLRDLTDEMRAGRVGTLVILGSNPVYTAPADLQFSEALQKVPLRVHVGLYDDETAVQCHWHVPESHYLEAWGDARAYDGTVSIIQPLIKPLYESRSYHEVLAALLGRGDQAGYDLVRGYWQRERPEADFDAFWRKVVQDGVVPDTAAEPATVALQPGFASSPQFAPRGAGSLEIAFRPDPTLWDGRFANNGWLQELPKPLTTLTWDNAALMAPATAEARGLRNGDLVELRYRGRSVQAPVWILPGHPADCVTVYLGHGRTRAGTLGTGTGFNAYALRTLDAPWFDSGLELRKVGRRYPLATTQVHFAMEGRDLVRAGTLADLTRSPAKPAFMAEGEEGGALPSLYPQDWPSDRRWKKGAEGTNGEAANPAEPGALPYTYEGTGYGGHPIPAWGMVIDQNTCIGCNACTIACQAENNIPVVGKKQVLVSREMHWLRIDTYHEGTPETPETYFQPVPCMHCEKAPCEPVCPVAATTHSSEGLNEMTYNRCVGTRYCSNNCPYKVRRFNFLQFSRQDTPTIQMMSNPDVTVRSRGVMEKCTYCVQRINEGRIQAEKEGRALKDGDVVTACQQVCPTQAIIFGDINDRASNQGRGSQVRQLKASPLNYGLLTELNTLPRTTYLAKVWNPNPEIPGRAPGEETKAEGA